MNKLTEIPKTKGYVSPDCELIAMGVTDVICVSDPTEMVDETEGEW